MFVYEQKGEWSLLSAPPPCTRKPTYDAPRTLRECCVPYRGDLRGSELLRPIPPEAHISTH